MPEQEQLLGNPKSKKKVDREKRNPSQSHRDSRRRLIRSGSIQRELEDLQVSSANKGQPGKSRATIAPQQSELNHAFGSSPDIANNGRYFSQRRVLGAKENVAKAEGIYAPQPSGVVSRIFGTEHNTRSMETVRDTENERVQSDEDTDDRSLTMGSNKYFLFPPPRDGVDHRRLHMTTSSKPIKLNEGLRDTIARKFKGN
jgi:hypothetical protein